MLLGADVEVVHHPLDVYVVDDGVELARSGLHVGQNGNTDLVRA